MDNKQQWISAKIGKLINEGKSKDQAVAIAYSMYNRGDHMQEGGLPKAQFGGIQYANGQDLYANMAKNAQNMPPQTYTGIPTTSAPPFDQAGYNKAQGYDPNMGYTGYVQGDANLNGTVDATDKTDKFGNPTQTPDTNDWVKYNILNPYNQGMDLGTSLAYTGQQFGQGHTGQGVMGAGLSLLKGARSFLSGYGAGKGQYDVQKQYHDKMYNNDRGFTRTDNYQQGGDIFDPQSQTQSPDWISQGYTTSSAIIPPTTPTPNGDIQAGYPQYNTVVPGQAAAQDATIQSAENPIQAATPTPVETKNFDKNSARDTWTQKTGLPWSEAKRLGYTDGTATSNTKLLNDLHSTNFQVRSKPFTSPTQQAQQAKAAIIAQVSGNKQLPISPALHAAEDKMMSQYRYSPQAAAEELAYKSKHPASTQAVAPKGAYTADTTTLDKMRASVGDWRNSIQQYLGVRQQGGIHIDESHKGEFTAKANAAGMGVQEYAHHVMSNKEQYDPSTVKQANFAINATKFNHQEGGLIMQQGGLTNADMLTGNYMTGNGQQNPNVEVEGGEHIKNAQTGQVQEVVGKRHVNGGEQVNLPNQSKVLSDYTKIGAQNAKIFGEMFDIKPKAGDTFAAVLDKYNSKIGVKKLEEQEKELLDKLEKNSKTVDKSTKQINEDFLAKEIGDINKKKEALNKLKAQAFETIFNEQEKIPKKGDGNQILGKNGQPIKQEGGEQQDPNQGQGQPDPQQIIQAYAQMSGQDPQQVVQQLQGMQPDQQQAAIQQMMQAIQQGQGQQPQMRYGGELEQYQDGGYTFSTKYPAITFPGYDVTGKSIVPQEQLTNVEPTQHYVSGKGYGQQMQDVENTINTHDWYFNTPEKKEAFRQAVSKEGAQPEVLNFQKAYNQELLNRGKKAGLSEDQINSITKDIGFTGEGVKKLDSLFGAYTSSRPLYDLNKSAAVPPTYTGQETPEVQQRDVVKNIVPMEGLPYVMPPSAPIAPYLQQVSLNRLEGQKGSVENQLQASENARQAAMAATRGLPPAQAAAMMANYLSTSGQQDTQGIANQELQDSQNKARIEQYNAGQGDKEQLLNEQLKKQYEREAFGTLNVNEQNWRNYYDANQANSQAMSDKIERRNIMNVGLTNYQLNGNGGIDFVNKSPFQGADPSVVAYNRWFQTLTPEQQHAERIKRYAEMNNTAIQKP